MYSIVFVVEEEPLFIFICNFTEKPNKNVRFFSSWDHFL